MEENQGYGVPLHINTIIMNPIIVNNESYFQFTMNAMACPLPPRLHFHLPGITDEKRSQEGRICREGKPKGGWYVCKSGALRKASTNGWRQ